MYAFVIGIRISGMFNHSFPEHLMPVFPCLLIQFPVYTLFVFLLPDMTCLLLLQCQKYTGRQINKPAFTVIFLTPQNSLIFRRIFCQRIEYRLHRCHVRICQNRNRESGLRMCQIRNLIIKILRAFHQYNLWLFFIQKLPEMPCTCRRQMPDSKYIGISHFFPPRFSIKVPYMPDTDRSTSSHAFS